MSLRSYLQDHPTPFVWMWKATEQVLIRVKPLFERVGFERSSTIVHPFEEAGKQLFFNCQGCGQCVLHYSGMTCPMNCPKNLRNGPCGGVRLNGHCEVKPEMDCVWVKGYQRSQKTSYAHEFFRLNPPVDWRLNGKASWVTFSLGKDVVTTGSQKTMQYATDALPENAPERSAR